MWRLIVLWLICSRKHLWWIRHFQTELNRKVYFSVYKWPHFYHQLLTTRFLIKAPFVHLYQAQLLLRKKTKKNHWTERAHERAFAPLCPLLWEWKASLHIKTSNSSFVTRRGRSGRVHLHFTLSLLFSPSLICNLRKEKRNNKDGMKEEERGRVCCSQALWKA